MDTAAIVRTLRVSRTTFDLLFKQAQMSEKPMSFDAVAESAVGEAAFTRGIEYAYQHKFLTSLVQLLLDNEQADAALTAYFMKNEEHKAQLQAITDLLQPFEDPMIMGKRLIRHCQWVCKVCLDDVAFGTGVLIGPDLVLTAYHVVSPLFISDPADLLGPKVPDPEAAKKLSAVFDNYYDQADEDDDRQLATTKKVVAHPHWCVTHTPCHDDEANHRLPAELTQLAGLFDFAVIRLAAAVGDKQRRYKRIDDNVVVPGAGQPLLVYQHPKGFQLKSMPGKIVGPTPPNVAVFPTLRFLHDAGTQDGSSGGPCFDHFFNLIGLHQGEWKKRGRKEKINRGVPIMGIRPLLKKALAPQAATPLIWSLGEAAGFAPVLGCEAFQQAIWQSMQSWKERAKTAADGMVGGQLEKRLFVLNGHEVGMGKTFRTAVLTAMLPLDEHLLVNVPAGSIAKKNAADVATCIAQASEHDKTQFAPPPPDTTAAARLGPDLWAPLLSQLEKARKGRMVWLVLTDLNKHNIDGEGATDLLTLIYGQVQTLDWLRIVLDGMRGDLSIDLVPYIEWVGTPPLTAPDIERYLREFLSSYHLTADEALIKVQVKLLDSMYQKARQQQPDLANATLASAVLESVNTIMSVIA